MGLEQIKLSCRVQEQLINSAVALAPTPNFRDLTLTDIANAYGVTEEEAHKCFADVDELVDAVREFLSGIFNKNVPFPSAPDFPGAVTELIISYTCARSNPQLFRAMYSVMPAEPELSDDN